MTLLLSSMPPLVSTRAGRATHFNALQWGPLGYHMVLVLDDKNRTPPSCWQKSCDDGAPLLQELLVVGVTCWQKSCDDGAPLLQELLVVGVTSTCRHATRTALLTLPQLSLTPQRQISNGLVPHLPSSSFSSSSTPGWPLLPPPSRP